MGEKIKLSVKSALVTDATRKRVLEAFELAGATKTLETEVRP